MPDPPPSRRDVLRDASLSMAGVGFLPTILTAPRRGGTRRSIDDVLRVGIVGAGRRGGALLKRLGYSKHATTAPDPALVVPNVELVAVCDTFTVNREQALDSVARVHDRPQTYVDYREMLAEQDLDVVIVATPDFTHAPVAQAAVEAGCDVYVEKCAAHAPEQLRSLEAALEQHDQIVQVGYQLRQDELYRQAREVVARGLIGEVRLARMEVHRSGSQGALRHPLLEEGPAPSEDEVDWKLFLAGQAPMRPYDPVRYFEWRKFWDYSNGVCGDNQSHSLDAVEYMCELGLPGSATATGGTYTWTEGRETPDVLSAYVEYPDAGISVGFTEIDSNAHFVPGTFLFGTEGTLQVYYELKVYPDRFSKRYADSIAAGKLNPRKPMIHIKDPAAARAITGNPSEMWLAGRGATRTTRGDGTFDTTLLHLQNFFDSVRSRALPAAPLQVARNSTIGAMMSAESYRSGRRITPADLGFGAETNDDSED